MAEDRVDSLPAPEAMPPRPAVERFESVAVGGSVLLRVFTTPPVMPADGVLVVDRGPDIDLHDPLPSTIADGPLSFACERSLLDAGATFWLQVGGLSLGLPAPLARTLG